MSYYKYIFITSFLLCICGHRHAATMHHLDQIAKDITNSSSVQEFLEFLKQIDFQKTFKNKTIQLILTKQPNGYRQRYIETLGNTNDFHEIVDLKRSMVAIKGGDGSIKRLLTELMDNIDVMRAVNNVDWTKYVLESDGDDVVYIPGLPNGVSVDCGIRFAKYFGHIFNTNISLFDPRSMSKLIKSPAGKMIDSWGRVPSRLMSGNTHWLGAYDQCMSIPHAKYCAVNMLVMKKHFGIYGTCMPKQCTEHDVGSIYQSIFNKHLEFVKFLGGDQTNCAEESIEYSTGFIITISLCCFIGLLILLGTFADVMDVNIAIAHSPPQPRRFTNGRVPSSAPAATTLTDEQNHHHVPNSEDVMMIPMNGDVQGNDDETSLEEDIEMIDDGDTPIDDLDKEKKEKKSMILQILLCFSLARNSRAVFSTEVPKKAIVSLNGIRAISMFWVILGHLFFFGTVIKNHDNPLSTVSTLMRRFSYQPIANAYVSVDTFFVLSGLLLSYLSLRRMDKCNGRMSIPMLYMHRFLRLTPPYMFVILIWTNVFPYLFTGPLATMVRRNGDGGQCREYWWTNLLYINNFYPAEMGESVKDKTCLGWSWYLANDMQFHLLSPLVLSAFYFLEKRFKNTRFRHIGALVITVLCCVITVSIRAVLLAHHEFPGLISAGMMPDNPYPMGRRQDNLYVKPYTRFSPYIIGMFLGYVFSRNIVIRLHKKILCTLGWIMAFGFGYAVVYGPYVSGYQKEADHFNKTENVLYGSLNELTWSIAIAWVLYACHNGYAGIINKFLSWRCWIPLSRLTFGAYLLHPFVIFYFFLVHENPFHYQDNLMAFVYVSNLFFSFVVAFILAVAVEYPVLNLEKLLFKTG